MSHDDLRAKAKAATRGEHRHDRTRICPRCGLPERVNRFNGGPGQCPPGYWMTPDEIEAWDTSKIKVRREMERTLGAQPNQRSATPSATEGEKP